MTVLQTADDTQFHFGEHIDLLETPLLKYQVLCQGSLWWLCFRDEAFRVPSKDGNFGNRLQQGHSFGVTSIINPCVYVCPTAVASRAPFCVMKSVRLDGIEITNCLKLGIKGYLCIVRRRGKWWQCKRHNPQYWYNHWISHRATNLCPTTTQLPWDDPKQPEGTPSEERNE